MGTVSRILGRTAAACTLIALVCQPIWAATAEAGVSAEVLSPVTVCRCEGVYSGRIETKMSATRPEIICSPDTVARFDIIGDQDSRCTLVMSKELAITDRKGRTTAVCSLASTIAEHDQYAPRIRVAITARVRALVPNPPPSSAEFDVVVAYD